MRSRALDDVRCSEHDRLLGDRSHDRAAPAAAGSIEVAIVGPSELVVESENANCEDEREHVHCELREMLRHLPLDSSEGADHLGVGASRGSPQAYGSSGVHRHLLLRATLRQAGA